METIGLPINKGDKNKLYYTWKLYENWEKKLCSIFKFNLIDPSLFKTHFTLIFYIFYNEIVEKKARKGTTMLARKRIIKCSVFFLIPRPINTPFSQNVNQQFSNFFFFSDFRKITFLIYLWLSYYFYT